MKHQLKITHGDTEIVFPVTTNISQGGELEGAESKMADGSLVYDVLGFRAVVTYKYDYLPQLVFDALIPLLRGHKYLTATVLDIDNTEKTALYSVSYPTAEAFKLTNDGKAVWHNVEIKLTAKEVTAE